MCRLKGWLKPHPSALSGWLGLEGLAVELKFKYVLFEVGALVGVGVAGQAFSSDAQVEEVEAKEWHVVINARKESG